MDISRLKGLESPPHIPLLHPFPFHPFPQLRFPSSRKTTTEGIHNNSKPNPRPRLPTVDRKPVRNDLQQAKILIDAIAVARAQLKDVEGAVEEETEFEMMSPADWGAAEVWWEEGYVEGVVLRLISNSISLLVVAMWSLWWLYVRGKHISSTYVFSYYAYAGN